MHLGNLKIGESANIIGISPQCKGEIRQRLLDLGFIKGFKVMAQSISPLNNPIAYNIHNTLIALRQEDAKYILIEK